MPDRTDEVKFYTKDFLFDRRLVERNRRKGLITKEEYEAHLAALPDVSEKIEPVSETPTDESPIPIPPVKGEKPKGKATPPETFNTEEGEYD
ncbi:MAG: hypothetical protein D6795_06310 [Deltaproteobacteria bacterium]|nr:MAG: hypothetical protein D6795_06310 [Deltaproteobacteria bacterium]